MHKDLIKILYSDDYCSVINKPAGVLTHALNEKDISDTIASWWLAEPEVAKIGWQFKGREGIVHRLDRDTSGALLLAKNPEALLKLQKQFHDREVGKIYIAVVFGKPDKEQGRVVSKISRDIKRRTKRVTSLIDFMGDKSVEAISNYKVIKTGNINKNVLSVINFEIETGKTHQIRLHAKMLGAPILGDVDYGTKPSKRLSKFLNISRQLLHAKELTFNELTTGKRIDICAPIPYDIESIAKKINGNSSIRDYTHSETNSNE